MRDWGLYTFDGKIEGWIEKAKWNARGYSYISKRKVDYLLFDKPNRFNQRLRMEKLRFWEDGGGYYLIPAAKFRAFKDKFCHRPAVIIGIAI